MADNTASSLRAAALLSLESKRLQRRGPPAPLSSAQQADTVSLIYDEPLQTPPVTNSSSTGVKNPMDVDEADPDLEDGEINDTNDMWPKPPAESQPIPPVPQPIPAKPLVSAASESLAMGMIPLKTASQLNEQQHSQPDPVQLPRPPQHVRPLRWDHTQHICTLTPTPVRPLCQTPMTHPLGLDRYGLTPLGHVV